MTLAIFTLVEHKKINGLIYGYAPYIHEMNMWTSHFDKVIVVGNYLSSQNLEAIDAAYSHKNITLVQLPKFHTKSFGAVLKLFYYLPLIFFRIFKVMVKSDYFHFRCPSNVSAIAAIIQVFFPKKPKSTKYAGNWNPSEAQPWGYRFQKWLLSNRILTKNMTVLVYGDYPNQSKSVVPFISATYKDSEKVVFKPRDFSGTLKFVFIGAMVEGKRPKLTIDIMQELIRKGYDIRLHMYGDGPLLEEMEQYVKQQQLEGKVIIYGNRDKVEVKKSLLDAHFTILPSKSEGWPKAIAEGMFFGAIPVSTSISCLPWILDYGKRGILVEPNAKRASDRIIRALQNRSNGLNVMAEKALIWSQQYTVNRLEEEIYRVVKENYK